MKLVQANFFYRSNNIKCGLKNSFKDYIEDSQSIAINWYYKHKKEKFILTKKIEKKKPFGFGNKNY